MSGNNDDFGVAGVVGIVARGRGTAQTLHELAVTAFGAPQQAQVQVSLKVDDEEGAELEPSMKPLRAELLAIEADDEEDGKALAKANAGVGAVEAATGRGEGLKMKEEEAD